MLVSRELRCTGKQGMALGATVGDDVGGDKREANLGYEPITVHLTFKCRFKGVAPRFA